MFTGIVEEVGTVTSITREEENIHIEVKASFTPELTIDQSIAHHGACLTVVKLADDRYTVTAIQETLDRTNLGTLGVGSPINLERCMIAGSRLDGHIVQGHVDQCGTCLKVEELDGSWKFHFSYQPGESELTVPKGSITINGVSLTVVDAAEDRFSVAIIPYTYEHTTFKHLKAGDRVNLEFDIIGKYVARILALRSQKGSA